MVMQHLTNAPVKRQPDRPKELTVPHIRRDPVTGFIVAYNPDGTIEPFQMDAASGTYIPAASLQGRTTNEPEPFVPTFAPEGAEPPPGAFGIQPSRRAVQGAAPRGGQIDGGYAENPGAALAAPVGGNSGGGAPAGGPRYADGSYHPLQGGAPRVAGANRFNGGDPGSSQSGGQRQIWSTSGAGAGPVTRAAPSPASPGSTGGHSSGSGGGGGGGGDVRGVISAWRDKLIGAAYPGKQSDSYGDYPSYPEYEDPYAKEKMRGWAKGMDPAQAAGFALRPQGLIPIATKGQGLEAADPEMQQLTSFPMGSLSLLEGSGGKHGKRFDGGPNDLVNQIADNYEDASVAELMPDESDVRKGLEGGKKGSYMRTHFKDPAVPMGTAAYEYQTMLNDAMDTYANDITAAKYKEYGDFLLNKAVAKASKKPAGKVNIARQVGRHLFTG